MDALERLVGRLGDRMDLLAKHVAVHDPRASAVVGRTGPAASLRAGGFRVGALTKWAVTGASSSRRAPRGS